MTSASLVFALLPIAIGSEEGSSLYRSIGVLIIGGMITSTFLSLFVVPSMYTFFDDLQHGLSALLRWRPSRRRTPELVPAPPVAVPGAASFTARPLSDQRG